MSDLKTHLETRATTVCRAWDLTRRDGKILGFTDHDRDLLFDDITYQASAALDGAELQSHLGLTPDNGAVAGALQSENITEEDILDGFYDDASVRAWLVNWNDPDAREIIFAGYIGTIEIADGRFTAELRSHSDRLNQPFGRRYLRSCGAELGSAACGIDLAAEYSATASILSLHLPYVIVEFSDAFEDGWFTNGVAQIGQRQHRISRDYIYEGERRLIIADLQTRHLDGLTDFGVTAGCDKSLQTCASKFQNVLNFQGFPFIPGEDSALATPQSGGGN